MRQLSRRLPSVLTLIVLLGLVLTACGGAGEAPSPTTGEAGGGQAEPTTAPTEAAEDTTQPTETTETTEEETPAAGGEGNVLRIHQDQYPDIFDPQKSSFVNEIAVLNMAYEGLTRLDENLSTVPAAAEKWEFNEAGTVLTFTMRADLKYSDGSPLTAENFEYSLLRAAHPETAGQYQSIIFGISGAEELASTPPTDTQALEQAIENFGVEAVDEQTLVIELKRPAPYFPTIMGLWVTYPVKQELVEAGGDTWWQDAENHVGNGPFKIAEIQQDQQITFEANENYWNGAPASDSIEYIYIEDSSVALEAYRSGQIDIMEPDPSQIPAIKGDAQLQQEVVSYAEASTFNLQPNLTQEPFTDKKVREAFSYAFDRETYCSEIRNDTCSPTLSWIPPGIPGAIETDKFGYDPEAAKQALQESSYGGASGLPPVSITFNSSDPANRPRAEWVAATLGQALGIQIELNPVEGKTLVQMRKQPETYPQLLFASGWIQDYPDPQNWLSVFWTCDSTFAQRPGYCNEELDQILAEADTELNPEKRIELYTQAGELLVEDVPGPFLYNRQVNFLVKPYVTGYTPTPSDAAWPGLFASSMTITAER